MSKIEMLGHFVSDILGLDNENTQVYFRCTRPADVCSFGANLLHLGNVGKQVCRRFLGLQTFHVKLFSMPATLNFPKEDHRVYESEGLVVESAREPAEFPEPETFP